jgi:hypothetical protein
MIKWRKMRVLGFVVYMALKRDALKVLGQKTRRKEAV